MIKDHAGNGPGFVALIAFDLVFVIDRLACLRIDITSMNAIARRAVDGMKAHLVRIGGGGQHRHWTGHERLSGNLARKVAAPWQISFKIYNGLPVLPFPVDNPTTRGRKGKSALDCLAARLLTAEAVEIRSNEIRPDLRIEQVSAAPAGKLLSLIELVASALRGGIKILRNGIKSVRRTSTKEQ